MENYIGVECKHLPCGERAMTQGFCDMHYYRFRNGVDMDIPKRQKSKNGLCEHPNCENPYKAKGYCIMHYNRLRTGRDLDLFTRALPNSNKDKKCLYEGCEKGVRNKGLCNKHIQRSKSITRKARNFAKVGDVRMYEDGYIREKTESGWKSQHRIIMEKQIGRPLLKEENVHHINGIRNDNRIENLELWSTSQAIGQRVIDKIKWAENLLQIYAPIQNKLK